MRWLFAISALGLVVSLGIHLYTFLPGSGVEKYVVWEMYICIYPLFFYMLYKLGNDKAALRYISFIPEKTRRWMFRMNVAFYIYAIVNVAMLVVHIGHGWVEIWGENYVRRIYGRELVVFLITDTEYHQALAEGVRYFSGHWIFFYSLPMTAFFVYWRGLKQPTP